jgi:flagellar hook assembly protein FlgD
LGRVYNYPNPFTTSTQFFFEYNVNCVSLDVKVEIFTISGKLIKTLFKKTNQLGVVSDGISWDGLDEFGEKLARGVYVYRLTTRESSGVLSEKLEKLVLF